MTGYSGTPLPQKLGMKPGHSVVVVHAPDDFEQTLGDLPVEASLTRGWSGPADMVIVFATNREDIEGQFREAMMRIPPDGAIWVAWPKRSSGVQTDLTEDAMREMFLPTGMVDTKVCAIDETWSGLRFVVRSENRPAWRP